MPGGRGGKGGDGEARTDMDVDEMSRWEDVDAHVATQILCHASAKDLASWMACSHVTRNLAEDDAAFWRELCLARWSDDTAPTDWIQRGACESYRELYLALHRLERVVGHWRSTHDLPRGGHYRFRWTKDRIVGEHIDERRANAFANVCSVECVQHVDARHLALRWEGERRDGTPSPESRAAAAAARVRADGATASPEDHHFEREMLRFMAGTVAARGSRRRRSSTSATPQPMRFFERVEWDPKDVETPYGGLWTVHRPHAHVETVCVTHRDGSIVATKVVGDEYVPAGEVDWIAQEAQAFGRGEKDVRPAATRWEADANTRLECGHKAKAQVALPGYRDPQWMDGYLVKLSDGSLLLAYETVHSRNARLHRLVIEEDPELEGKRRDGWPGEREGG